MSHLGPVTYPFEIVSIDDIIESGGSRSTKTYLHLLVDHFTWYAFILKTLNLSDVIKLLQNSIQNWLKSTFMYIFKRF